MPHQLSAVLGNDQYEPRNLDHGTSLLQHTLALSGQWQQLHKYLYLLKQGQ